MTPDIKPGDIVEWTSQSAGTWKTKRGKVIAIVPAGKSAFAHIPSGTPKSRVKGDMDISVVDRLVVEVPRANRRGVDYYTPRVKHVRKVEEY